MHLRLPVGEEDDCVLLLLRCCPPGILRVAIAIGAGRNHHLIYRHTSLPLELDPESGTRFSGKIMLKRKIVPDFDSTQLNQNPTVDLFMRSPRERLP
jgi:hypothetical protein